MSQQSQGMSSASPGTGDIPMKRKRGRPRKDDTLFQAENMPAVPGSDSLKKNKQNVGTSDSGGDDMVGKVVSGVIEGSFDAGYLLNVQVGDTDTHLRGVVFLPGRFTPITEANDVAPNAKMHIRKEIPIPDLKPQDQSPCSVPPSEPSNKQPVELKNCVPKLPDQVQPPKLESKPEAGVHETSVPIAGETQSIPAMTPLADKLPTNETASSIGENVPPQQMLEPTPENQAAPFMAQSNHGKVVEQDGMKQEFEASAGIEGLSTDVGATKESELLPGTSVDALPCSEAVNQEPPAGHIALSSVLKPIELLHDEVKGTNLEHSQTPVFSEPASISSETIGINNSMEKQTSLIEDAPQITELNLGSPITNGQLNGMPLGDAATIAGTGSNSAPITSLPASTFEGEAISSEVKIPTEGSALPSMIDNQICSSGDTADNRDCIMTDAIPSAQS